MVQLNIVQDGREVLRASRYPVDQPPASQGRDLQVLRSLSKAVLAILASAKRVRATSMSRFIKFGRSSLRRARMPSRVDICLRIALAYRFLINRYAQPMC